MYVLCTNDIDKTEPFFYSFDNGQWYFMKIVFQSLRKKAASCQKSRRKVIWWKKLPQIETSLYLERRARAHFKSVSWVTTALLQLTCRSFVLKFPTDKKYFEVLSSIKKRKQCFNNLHSFLYFNKSNSILYSKQFISRKLLAAYSLIDTNFYSALVFHLCGKIKSNLNSSWKSTFYCK